MKKTNRFDFEYVCGASFIIQKTESMPFFDESYFLYYEDCDYGMLLNQNGYNYKKLENVHFLHKIGGSGEKQKKNKKKQSIYLNKDLKILKLNLQPITWRCISHYHGGFNLRNILLVMNLL